MNDTEMKLWILKPREVVYGTELDLWKPWYDKAFGYIVRAESEEEARKLGTLGSGIEAAEAWLDAKYPTCEELLPEGKSEIVLSDINHA